MKENKMSNDLTTGNKNSMLAPNNFEHYFRIANMMSKSDMVPKSYKDDETFEALKTLHDKEYSPDEIYQASLYIAVTESGDHD